MSSNIFKQDYRITKAQRNNLHGHKSILIWFTGLSGSGKSTLANLVESVLHEKGVSTYILDGDNIRNGVNNDLNFSTSGRKENIRRVSEICKLMLEAGIVTLACFVSPYIKDRDKVREIVEPSNFIEIYVNASVAKCELRDVKGLYKKARSGEIRNLTGINDYYEAPINPDIEVMTDYQKIEDSVEHILSLIFKKLNIVDE